MTVFLRWSRIHDWKLQQTIILATRGPQSWGTDIKNLQMAISRSIIVQFFFLLQGSLLGSNSASYKRNWKSVKICFLDLNLPCFQLRGLSGKIKKKNFKYENKKCLYIVNKHILFPWPISKMSWWFSIKKNMKKRVFCHFWPLDGVKITQKHRFLIRSVQLSLFRHLNQNSTLSGM